MTWKIPKRAKLQECDFVVIAEQNGFVNMVQLNNAVLGLECMLVMLISMYVQTHLSPSTRRVSRQCAAAGASLADHSGQTPSHSLDSHTDKASLL